MHQFSYRSHINIFMHTSNNNIKYVGVGILKVYSIHTQIDTLKHFVVRN